ncbi:MAG: hypothetical protein IPF99_31665 [Deltaproteobacteria bacterium]|nr:hypothetical protein [Deltaproteobacteria bacterium]
MSPATLGARSVPGSRDGAGVPRSTARRAGGAAVETVRPHAGDRSDGARRTLPPEAALGDPNALVIATTLKALELALRDDPDTATRFLNDAYAYLRRRRPDRVPLGAGDPRLICSGHKPAAALEVLKIASRAIAQLPPLRREGPDGEDQDAYLDQADALAWCIEHLYPAIYPNTVPGVTASPARSVRR